MGPTELRATFRNDSVLVEVYKSCGFTITHCNETTEYVKLSIQPHLLDVRRIQMIVFALYAIRNVTPSSVGPSQGSCVPIEGKSCSLHNLV